MGLIYVHDGAKHELIKVREFQKSCPIEIDHVVMSRMHAFCEHEHQAAWQLIRMVYGARKLGHGADPLGKTVESIHTACQITGLKRGKLETMLGEMFEAFYVKEMGKKPETGRPKIVFPGAKGGRKPGQTPHNTVKQRDGTVLTATAPMAVVATEPVVMEPEPEFGNDDDVLNHFGFNRKIFECEGREDVTEKQEEIAWFCSRLKEIKRLFDEPMTKELARRAIIGEMLLRRIDCAMTREDVSGDTFSAMQKTKDNLEENYAAQWAQIDSIIPYASAVQSKQTFAGVISDLVNAVQRWEANHDMTLVDGIFTKYEVEILMRQAQQHEIRYRPSLPMYWKAVQQNLWDADWKNTMPTRVLKLLDAGFKGAVAAVNEKGGIFLPDLESDGSDGEYPQLGSGPIGMPKEEVAVVDEVPDPLKNIPQGAMVPIT